jgi:hypothetical protein
VGTGKRKRPEKGATPGNWKREALAKSRGGSKGLYLTHHPGILWPELLDPEKVPLSKLTARWVMPT